MRILQFLIVLGLAGGGYQYWKTHSGMTIPTLAGPAVSASGFAALPPAEGQDARSVYVIAAEDCPEDDALRADRLAQDLGRSGIPVIRAHNISFRLSGPDGSGADRISSVMNGRLPIVFVRGRAKSNPTLAEVVAEYKNPAQ